MNYYTNNINRSISSIGTLINALSGRINSDGGPLECAFTNEIDAMFFNRVEKYRKSEADSITFDLVNRAISNVLSRCHNSDSIVGYFLVSDGISQKIYYAAEKVPFAKQMEAFVPDLVVENGFVSKNQLTSIAQKGGVVVGNFKLDGFAVDSIMDAMQGIKGMVAIISKPVNKAALDFYRSALHNASATLDSFSSIGVRISSDNHRIKTVIPCKNEAEQLLAKHIKRFDDSSENVWETVVYFSAENEKNAQLISNSIVGAFNTNNTLSIYRAQSYYLNCLPMTEGSFAFPYRNSNRLSAFSEAFNKSELSTYLTSSELASIMQLPSRSHAGVEVVDLYKKPSDVNAFDVLPLANKGKSFGIGVISGSGLPFSISFDDIKEHMLVTGATGGGKTTTVFNVIENANKNQIPFCVLELAKKEYWHICDVVKDVHVYSAGFDATPLRFNPLEPEDGVFICNHIDGLMQCFAGAFHRSQDETAIFAHLHGLIAYVYESFGWKPYDRAFKGLRPYPTLWDLKKYNPEYSQKHNHSDADVKQNIDAAVIRRLDMLTTGIGGEVFKTQHSITGAELCNNNCIVELEDFKGEMKSLIAGFLVNKISDYLKQLDSKAELSNILVLEEAHNIIAKTNSSDSPQALASKYFSVLLSEIRSYGTGVVISDQTASGINDSAITNTKVKIMHRVASGEDVDAEAFAFKLNDFQKRLIPSLGVGEALVAVGGHNNVCKINVLKKQTPDKAENCACIFCKARSFCSGADIQKNMNVDTKMLVDRVLQNRGVPGNIKAIVNQYFDSKLVPANNRLCNFGYILANTNTSFGELEKRRILYNYTKVAGGA